MNTITIILASTRPGRNGDQVLTWAKAQLADMELTKVKLNFIDLRDWQLPMFDNPDSPMTGKYHHPIVKKWSAEIANSDGFLIVTPEYNHGYPAVLKNALDHLYHEWNAKPITFLSYGGLSGGLRAVEQLRQVAVELQMMPLRESTAIRFVWEAFDEQGQLLDGHVPGQFKTTVNQLVEWTQRLATKTKSA